MPGTGRGDAQGQELTLKDGSVVAVRPVTAADKEAIRSAFERLSPETRYRRFFSLADALSDQQLRYLTELDHHDHEALIAYEPQTRNGIAVARFVRSPDDPQVAEAAVVVGDAWQAKGLGTALSALLAQRGREEGIQRLDATLLAGNDQMLHVIDSLGPSRLLAQDGPTITVEVDISNESLPPHMRGVLRAVARGDAELAPRELNDSDS